MPKMTTTAAAKLTHLEERIKKLATDKSALQLLNHMMNKLNAVPGLDNTVENMLRTVSDVIGGVNLSLYYLIDHNIYYADVYGHKQSLETVADSLVKKVFETREPLEVEHEFNDTRMMAPEFSQAYTWIVPLLVGPELVGVLKMESLNIAMREMSQQLPTFFNYAALVLKNEIVGYTRLKQAYDDLAQEMKIRRQVEADLRQANEALEDRVITRTTELQNTNEQLRHERVLLRRIMETSPVAITVVNRDGQVTFANPQAEKVLGLTKDAITQRSYNAPEWRITDNAGGLFPEEELPFRRVMSTGQPVYEVQHAIAWPNGRRCCLSINGAPILTEVGEVESIVFALEDITERKRAEEALHRLNRELSAISNCNQILLRAVDEQTLLNDICRIVCDEAGYRLAWVGYAEHDEAKTVRPVAWAGVEDGYLAAANITWADTERGRGPSGIAIRTGESACIQDFTVDPKAAPWRENALQRGYRSSIALPLKDENANAFGILCIYSTEPNAFTSDEIRLLEELAGDLAFGITVLRARVDRKRAEESLRASEERFSAAFRFSPIPIAIFRPADGYIVDVNDVFVSMLGYSREEIIGRTTTELNLYVDPEDRHRIQQILAERGSLENFEFGIRRKSGEPSVVLNSVRLINLGGEKHYLSSLVDITARKQAEQKAKELAAIVRSSDDAITGKTLDGIITSWNRGAEKIYGYTESEMIGQPISTLVPPGYEDEVPQILNSIKAGRYIKHYETVRRRKDGTLVNVSLAVSPIRDSGGRVVAASTIARDITERKQAEEALWQTNELLERVFANVDLLIAYMDTTFTFVRVNRAYAEADQRTPDFFVGKNHFELYPNEENEAIFRRVVQTGESYFAYAKPFEYAEHPERGVTYWNWTLQPIKEVDGRIGGVLLSMVNVTERERAEEELARYRNYLEELVTERTQQLQQSEEHYRRLFETMLQGVVYQTADGKISSLNPAAERILGVTPSELLGQTSADKEIDTIREDGSPFPAPEHPAMVALHTGHQVQDVVMGIYNPREQSYRWLNVSAVPMFRPGQDQPYQVYTLFDDITERKQVETQIRQLNQDLQDRAVALETANKELEAFAYSVSHDLRAPLRHIDGFLELLQQSIAGALDERSQHYMSVISDSARRMGILIDDLLAFSRMGRNEMSKTQVDLDSLVQEIIQDFGPETQGRSIRWHIAPLPPIIGDQAMMRLVWVNLISNALKFTRGRPQAEIEIGCQAGKKESIIFIRDNGVGFDMAYADKLFGVFQRLHRADEFEGTGIGLANVRRIIQRHGGRTWAEGEVNRGATFYFSLPQSVQGI